jgi:hypothetical protein
LPSPFGHGRVAALHMFCRRSSIPSHQIFLDHLFYFVDSHGPHAHSSNLDPAQLGYVIMLRSAFAILLATLTASFSPVALATCVRRSSSANLSSCHYSYIRHAPLDCLQTFLLSPCQSQVPPLAPTPHKYYINRGPSPGHFSRGNLYIWIFTRINSIAHSLALPLRSSGRASPP